MIVKLKLWTQNIIIAVVISIIIEMILPDGNNKKYVKIITGLYILYVIIHPILGLKNEDAINEIKSLITENEAIATFSESDVANTYLLSLQNALKVKIEELGYEVNDVKFYITSDYSDVVKIEINMKNGKYDENAIKKVILEIYEIDSNNIVIN